MKANIIDGKAIAKEIQKEVTSQIQKLGLNPGLGVILVGNDPCSELYVKLKQKAAQKVGINFNLYNFDEDIRQEEILETIEWLNKDEEIDAILVQLPLPKHLDTSAIIKSINPKKDVDGFHPENIKAYLNNEETIVPGLSMGIAQLLQSTQENLSKKECSIIARSKEFTQTLKHTLKAFDINSSIINPDDKNALDKIDSADIVITASGKPNWIQSKNIKDHSILIDVGTTQVKEKTIGDIDFESCSKKADWITPVPGGVGPMTVAMLLKNTIALANKK